MMTERTVPDEFDTILRTALDDVVRDTDPDPGLADMLIANSTAGRPVVVSLAARSRARRWAFPLLAVASVVVLAVGAVVVAHLATGDNRARPAHHSSAPAPTPVRPPQPAVVPHFRGYSVDFADATHGWALGAAKCPTGARTDCATLLTTRDGGGSWQVATLPKGLVTPFDSASCGTNGTVTGPCVDNVLFANDSDGYLWSLHTMYRTSDGGRSWSRYVDPAHQWDGAARLVAVGSSVVRIAPIAPCSSGCAGRVETAPVGTFDWHVTRPSTRPIGLYSSNLSVAGSQIYLFAGGTTADAGPGIFRSADGGRQWTPVAHDACGPARSPENDPFYGTESIAADDGALVAACLAPRAGVRVAAPGSASLSGLRAYPRHGDFELEGAQSARRIVIADTRNGYGPGPVETTFYVTSDGGLHWRRTVSVAASGATVRFLPGGRGYAAAADAAEYYATADGGVTWTRELFGS
jgi:hypothetical protein